MKKKYIGFTLMTLSSLVHSASQIGLYPPLLYERIYQHFYQLPSAFQEPVELDDFDQHIIKFLYGPIDQENIKYTKKEWKHNIDFLKRTDTGSNGYEVKRGRFFWELKDFTQLTGLEKQIARYYKATPKSKIEFFYALYDPIFRKEDPPNLLYKYYINRKKIHDIWGIRIDEAKYFITWIASKNPNNKEQLLVDKANKILAIQATDGAIKFLY